MFARMAVALAAVLLAVLFAAPAEARWVRAESPRFIVYSDTSESVARAYAEKMEIFDNLLRARHGLPEAGVPLRKLPIYLVRDNAALKRTWFAAGDAVLGYYMPGALDTFAVATANGDDVALLHEYAHHFMLGNFPGVYPAWMVEGFAEYYAATTIDAKFIEVGRVQEWRTSTLMSGKWLSMTDLLSNNRSAKQWDEFYGQSWLLTHYLMSDPARFQQFRTYLSLVAKGGDPVQSMVQATGMSPDALQAALKKYKSGGLSITQYRRPATAGPAITITVLPASADDLLLERVEMMANRSAAPAPGYLDMVTRRAAKYPDDRLALLTVGYATLRLGDFAAGRGMLESWIKSHPDDAEARFLLASQLRDKASAETDEAKANALRADAREIMAPALAAASNDYRVAFYYARSRQEDPGYPDKTTLDALIAGYKQAPQVVPLRLELVRGLIVRGHLREARALLAPVVNNPHGGEAANMGKALLKEIDEREKAG